MVKPKVLSLFKLDKFENRFLNVQIIGKPVDLFVECKSYDIEIPINSLKKKELDIFEETILRMVALKKITIDDITSETSNKAMSPEEVLANTLCLKKDLINFILIRLIESGLLEDKQTISDAGKQMLQLQDEIRKEVQFVQGKVFMIKKTGLILPYVHIGEFQSENVDEFTSNSITLGYGSAGNYRRVFGKCLRNSDFEKRADAKIDNRVLKRTIRNFNRIAKAQNLLGIDLNEEYGIASTSGDNIYIHLQAVIQNGNIDEVIFSDGFVSNIDGMMDYIHSEKPELFKEIKASAVDMTIGQNDSGEKKTYISQKYKEMYLLYRNVCKHTSVNDYDDSMIDERKEINEDKRQIIIDCYYMVEWAFYYYTSMNKLSDNMVELFKHNSKGVNCDSMLEIAESIGIAPTILQRCINLFSHFDGSRIDSVYANVQPKLYICLPLAIAEAKENMESPIYKLLNISSEGRNFLVFINFLNNQCMNLRHNSNFDAVERKAMDIFNGTKAIVNTLLPDLNLDEVVSGKNITNASEARLLALVSLEKALGSIYFNALEKNVRNEWIKISPDKKKNQMPEPYEYVMILSRILEDALQKANYEFDKKGNINKEQALDILGKRYSGKIPKSFSFVKKELYNKAKNGFKASLGTAALVYIANVDADICEKVLSEKYIQVVDHVCELRGHGTNVALSEDIATLNILRDEIIKLIRIIGGFYV
jgi:hypothetical protein